MNIKLLTSFIALAAVAGSASAQVVFADDFQSPDVTGNVANTSKQRDNSLWGEGGSGYGADRHGVVDEDSGAFLGQTTPGVNDGEQAYGFRYTSGPGIFSAAGATSTTISDGLEITLTFDAVEDLLDNGGAGSGIQYDAYIFAVDTGATGFSRTIGGTGVTTLARLTDTVSAGVTAWTTGIELSYTVGAGDSALFGQELAIGFKDSWIGSAGTAPSSAMIDNVSLTAVPEPSSFALLAGCFGLAWIMVRRRG